MVEVRFLELADDLAHYRDFFTEHCYCYRRCSVLGSINNGLDIGELPDTSIEIGDFRFALTDCFNGAAKITEKFFRKHVKPRFRPHPFCLGFYKNEPVIFDQCKVRTSNGLFSAMIRAFRYDRDVRELCLKENLEIEFLKAAAHLIIVRYLLLPEREVNDVGEVPAQVPDVRDYDLGATQPNHGIAFQWTQAPSNIATAVD